MRQPFLLDVTRLFSRRFAPIDTGIDRVERGVFQASALDPRNRYLIRSGKFYFILDHSAVESVLETPKLGRMALSKLLFQSSTEFGYKRIRPKQLKYFFHLGHISHETMFWKTLKQNGVNISILIHDVIPLDYPETCRDDQLSKFSVNFNQWISFANQVITPSQYTKKQIIVHAKAHPKINVVPLYVPKIHLANLAPPENAYVVVGTIEPRKNLMILLQLWEMIYQAKGASCPKLWIIGARGWKNQQVFDFLDNSPLMNQVIFELGALEDAQMYQRIAAAKAVLFPTIAEGFGLPFYEAILSGKPVYASKIPAFEEVVTQSSRDLLLPTDNIAAWEKAVNSSKPSTPKLLMKPASSWEDFLSNIALNTKANIDR